MKLCVVGAGYVGLVTAACLSKIGHDITCVESDPTRLALLSRGECPIFEPGLAAIIKESMLAGNIRFTSDINSGVKSAKAIFIAVGTPSKEDGSSDITQVTQCALEIAAAADENAVIVTKSTVPVGTNRHIATLVKNLKPQANLMVGSNPEFLREGSAIKDFEAPDRIVFGFADQQVGDIFKTIYQPFVDQGFKIIQTNFENAELIKYAANAFLAMKVTFANELSDLCEVTGGDMEAVAKGIGLDSRIGPRFLVPGPGYGGSCFPKDTQALAHMGREFAAPQTLVEAVIARNQQRKLQVGERILALLGDDLRNKTVCVWGIAFKANTDDFRDAPALTIIRYLEDAGVTLNAHDPEAAANASRVLSKTSFFESPLEAASGADLLVVLTEWAEYRSLPFAQLKKNMKGKVVLDFRNILPAEILIAEGFEFYGIGKGRSL